MKGHKEVLAALDDVLAAELTAHKMYFIHYAMEDNRGYKKLAGHFKEDAKLELHHAEEIIERILFLEGVPNLAKQEEFAVGSTSEEHLKNQYALETGHVERIQKHIKLCMEKNDFGTKEILDEILEETESQCHWLETQFQRIKDIGIKNYLSEHMHD